VSRGLLSIVDGTWAIYRSIAGIAVTNCLVNAAQFIQVLFIGFNVTSRSSLMAVQGLDVAMCRVLTDQVERSSSAVSLRRLTRFKEVVAPLATSGY